MEHLCQEVKNMLENYNKEKNQIFAQNIPARCQQCQYDLTPVPFTWLNMTSLYKRGEKIFFCDKHIDHEDTDSVYMNLTDGSFWCRTCETRFSNREDFTETIGSILNTYDSPGTRGLTNLGNTCFMNSVVQALSNCSKLKYFLYNLTEEQIQSLSKVQGFQIIHEFINLIKMLWKKGPNIDPQNFVNSVYDNTEMFVRKQQSDAHEFLLFLIDRFYESFKTCQISSFEDIFQGETVVVNTCLACNTQNSNIEKFFDITIPVIDVEDTEGIEDSKIKMWISKLKGLVSIFSKGKKVEIMDCFEEYFKKLVIDDNDMSNWKFCYACDQKAPFRLETYLKKPPLNLIVVLKRYSRHSKSTTHVYFPETIDLGKYSEYKESKAVYNLTGIVEHVGFMNIGHYKGFCKNHLDNKWYCFNDKSIKEITIGQVSKIQGYIGFYEFEEV